MKKSRFTESQFVSIHKSIPTEEKKISSFQQLEFVELIMLFLYQ